LVEQKKYSGQKAGSKQQGGAKSKTPVSTILAVNITKMVELGALDHRWRETEIERVSQILSRVKRITDTDRRTGVGKTAICEGLALRIVKEKFQVLFDKRCCSLDLRCISGRSKYRGQFEKE